MKRPDAKVSPEPETVVLDAEAAAKEFRLPVVDAVVLVGSGVRRPAAWLAEYRTRKHLDFTFADCEMLTGTSRKRFQQYRTAGMLKVRATGTGLTGRLFVAPAELVRVLRKIAAERNGTTEIAETPTQARKRAEADRAAALAACRGE